MNIWILRVAAAMIIVIGPAWWLVVTVTDVIPENWKPVALILTLVCTAVVLVVGLWILPKMQVMPLPVGLAEAFDRENEARRTMAQIAGGFFLLLGLYTSAENLRISREGQITERYIRAVEQLKTPTGPASDSDLIRSGAIYGLERIAKDSERDNWPIMELLAAYIRANSPLALVPTEGRNPTLSTHVNAALSAFRRREWRRESREQKLIFEKSYLYDANFGRTHLAGAFFDASYLRAAYFCGADLPDAVFSNANLEFADFREANLRKARFDRANIRASDFSTAANLVPEQVRAATGWDQALYPQELVRQLQLPTDHNTKIATRFT